MLKMMDINLTEDNDEILDLDEGSFHSNHSHAKSKQRSTQEETRGTHY